MTKAERDVKRWLSTDLRNGFDIYSFPDAVVDAADYDRDITEMRRQRDEACAVLTRLVERMDSDADGGDGIFEDFVERIANEARAVLAHKEPPND